MPRATTMRHLIVLALEGIVVLAGVRHRRLKGVYEPIARNYFDRGLFRFDGKIEKVEVKLK